MKKGLLKLLVFIGVCLVLWWCKTPSHTSRQSIDKLEIPAYTEASYKQHLVYEGYEVVLNENYRIPEWVAYELTADEVSGTNPRSNHFRTDPNFSGRQADDIFLAGWTHGDVGLQDGRGVFRLARGGEKRTHGKQKKDVVFHKNVVFGPQR